ncbi:glycosyltransferase family 1 protein [Paraburkholderia fungorum]|jgi:glycosyltransferase involved in cell wall biosynthesis|uniref:glycosyltransferase family 4 protein n=1 Tax=Paraburkholderia fungorum TaxID=134537 RepID=UPI0038B7D18A
MHDIIFDGRWKGAHGIGRFAAEVGASIGLAQADLRGNPASPFDWLYLSVKLATRKQGIFFSPGYNYPLFYGGKGLLVIHDLIHFDVPSSYWVLKKLYCKVILRNVCRHASVVLTVSEFSRKRVAEFAAINPEKIVVVGNGVSLVFSDEGPRFSLEEGKTYFLGISNGKGHKNNKNVIQGFIDANLGDKVKLLFAGAPSKEITSFIKSIGAEDRIRFMGRISETELATLYRGALALIFPSLYEGFGLPIVESMACGTPVITSNCTAMPEVAGGAAILVDPLSPAQIADAVNRIHGNAELRRTMAEKGVSRARDFKWSDVAEKIEAVFIELNLSTDVRDSRRFS